jgi:acylphosphatase
MEKIIVTENICMNYFVSGKVQGVWFRASTQKVAMSLAVTGWVRNLPDGRVEVLACGTNEQVTQLEAWLQHGPELAEVTDLRREAALWQQYDKFDVT